MFVVHVWAELIAQFLKEGRRADADGKKPSHKVYVPIAFSPDDDRITDPITWIREQIAQIGSNYSSLKKQIEDTIGFENGSGTAKVTFDISSAAELVDWQLGLAESVKVRQFTYTPERFGIPAGRPLIDTAAGGNMFLQPTPQLGTLRLRMPSGEHVHLSAEIVIAALPGLSSDYWRVRIRTECLDIIVGGGRQASVSAKIKLREPLPLERILELTTLQAAEPGEQIAAQLSLGNKRVDIGQLVFDEPALRGAWERVKLAVETLQAVYDVAMFKDLQLTLAEVLHAGTELTYLTFLAGHCAMRLEFENRPETPEHFTKLLAYVQISIGKFFVGALVERGIKQDVFEDNTRRIDFQSPRLIDAFIDTDELAVQARVESAYDRQKEQTLPTDMVLDIGDLRRFVGISAAAPASEPDQAPCIPT